MNDINGEATLSDDGFNHGPRIQSPNSVLCSKASHANQDGGFSLALLENKRLFREAVTTVEARRILVRARSEMRAGDKLGADRIWNPELLLHGAKQRLCSTALITNLFTAPPSALKAFDCPRTDPRVSSSLGCLVGDSIERASNALLAVRVFSPLDFRLPVGRGH